MALRILAVAIYSLLIYAFCYSNQIGNDHKMLTENVPLFLFLSLFFFCVGHFSHRYFSAKRNNTKPKKKRQSLYSIEFSSSPPVDTILDYELGIESNRNTSSELSPKPMTPRRVKRRSVMTRGTNNRVSTNSRRSHSSSNRNSMRSSRRKFQQNPVTKLMDYRDVVHADLSTQNEGMKTIGIRTFFLVVLTSIVFIRLNRFIPSNASIESAAKVEPGAIPTA